MKFKSHKIIEKDGSIDDGLDGKRSVTFDDSLPEESPRVTARLEAMSIKRRTNSVQELPRLEDSISIRVKSDGPQLTLVSENSIAHGTEGILANDIWREPELQGVVTDIERITTKEVLNLKVHLRLQDWFYTNLYKRICKGKEHQFNFENDSDFFNTRSEAFEAMYALLNEAAQVPGIDKKAQFITTVAKTCKTLKKILVDELDFPRLYDRYILMVIDPTEESIAGLLKALGNLLQGR